MWSHWIFMSSKPREPSLNKCASCHFCCRELSVFVTQDSHVRPVANDAVFDNEQIVCNDWVLVYGQRPITRLQNIWWRLEIGPMLASTGCDSLSSANLYWKVISGETNNGSSNNWMTLFWHLWEFDDVTYIWRYVSHGRFSWHASFVAWGRGRGHCKKQSETIISVFELLMQFIPCWDADLWRR